MKDPRLWAMRLRGERDGKLSHPAFRLLSCLISDRVNSRDLADDEFPLAWSTASRWLRLEEKRCYVYLEELERRSYLKNEGRKGVLGRNSFRFLFIQSSSPLEGGTSSVGNDRSSSPLNDGPHISKSFRQGRVIGAPGAQSGGGRKSTGLRPQKAGLKIEHAGTADPAAVKRRLKAFAKGLAVWRKQQSVEPGKKAKQL